MPLPMSRYRPLERPEADESWMFSDLVQSPFDPNQLVTFHQSRAEMIECLLAEVEPYSPEAQRLGEQVRANSSRRAA